MTPSLTIQPQVGDRQELPDFAKTDRQLLIKILGIVEEIQDHLRRMDPTNSNNPGYDSR